jgi:hypothetical protein
MLVIKKLGDGTRPHQTRHNIDLKEILMEDLEALGHQPTTLKARGSGQVAQYDVATKICLHPVCRSTSMEASPGAERSSTGG